MTIGEELYARWRDADKWMNDPPTTIRIIDGTPDYLDPTDDRRPDTGW